MARKSKRGKKGRGKGMFGKGGPMNQMPDEMRALMDKKGKRGSKKGGKRGARRGGRR